MSWTGASATTIDGVRSISTTTNLGGDAGSVTTTITAGVVGSGYSYGPDMYFVEANAGGTRESGVAVDMVHSAGASTTGGGYVRSRVTFSRPVRNLTVLLTDFDAAGRSYNDAAALVTSEGAFATVARGTNVQGAGTFDSPFTAINPNFNAPNSSSVGNVTVTNPGPISTFDIAEWSRATGVARSQYGIDIATMTFDVFNLGCP